MIPRFIPSLMKSFNTNHSSKVALKDIASGGKIKEIAT
jgi:hypothetical protein